MKTPSNRKFDFFQYDTFMVKKGYEVDGNTRKKEELSLTLPYKKNTLAKPFKYKRSASEQAL